MPSAASVKFDRQFNNQDTTAATATTPAVATESSQNLTPLRQAITTIEHKIRNLEKRKSKLESYKELQTGGKELNADQKTAVAKFNEVMSTLDFARDLCKQFASIASASEKEAKKQAKKEAAINYQCELARLREILLVQDALTQMGSDSVRDDFLNGRNGAAHLTEADLKLLDDFYPAVTPKHEAGNPLTFTNEVQAAAEHLLAAVDGKPKEIFGGSYSQLKEILGKIHESGYFDRVHYEVESYVEGDGLMETVTLNPPELAVAEQEVILSSSEQELDQPSMPILHPSSAAASLPPMEGLTIEQRLPAAAGMPPQTIPAEIGGLSVQAEPVPTLPSRIPQPEQQQVYYQQPPLQVQQPAPRPITEMLGTGSFFFLQESEIDPLPEQQQQQIPSQTFTNQSFGSHPVPMPQQLHFNLPPNSHPVSTMGLVGGNNNNGIEENVPLRSPNNGQSYYQNSNNNNVNYNGRPRQPKTVSMRH